MLYFATYFDNNYLSRGIALYNSLNENCKDFFLLYVLCLDEATEQYFHHNQFDFPHVKTITLSEIEQFDTELHQSKKNRSIIEYYFTLSPCLPLYLLQKFNLSHICTLDADILFLSNPKSLFDYLENHSIVITPHKFSSEIKELEIFGKYNVSFQIFKNNEIGNACLKKWREQCIAWCSDVYDEENQRFADQKYLDDWINLYGNEVKELNDAVSGIAPWNLNNYQFKFLNNTFYSNSQAIIFYHFHHFKLFTNSLATNGFYFYKVKPNKILHQLYLYYWNKIDAWNKQLNIEKDNIKRTHLSQKNSVYKKLLDEGVAYFKLSSKKIIYLDFQTTKGRVFKYLIKYYA